MVICGYQIDNLSDYERICLKYKNSAKVFANIFILVVSLLLAVDEILVVIISNNSLTLGYSLGLLINLFIYHQIPIFMNKPWHDSIIQVADKDNPQKTTERKINSLSDAVTFTRAVVVTIIVVWLLISSLGSFSQAIIYCISFSVADLIYWLGFISAISCVIFVFFSVIFIYYLAKWFKYFRWTWEELKLPVSERKKKYKEQRRLEVQKQKQARKNKWKKLKNNFFEKFKSEKAGKVVNKHSKSVQYIDRKAELQNLYDLYKEGLIDEDEYKKAKEKILNI